VTNVRTIAAWIFGLASAVWALHGFVSILSKLQFVIDAWDWCVAQVPLSHRPILVEFGHRVSDWIAGYREFVHVLVQKLHLPPLPPLIYDVLGVVVFSGGRGVSLSKREYQRYLMGVDANDQMALMYHRLEERGLSEEERNRRKMQLEEWADATWRELKAHSPFFRLDVPTPSILMYLNHRTMWFLRYIGVPFHPLRVYAIFKAIQNSLVYGGLVTIIIAALFGIDYLYRHFA
jgi:hypothetical protein